MGKHIMNVAIVTALAVVAMRLIVFNTGITATQAGLQREG